MAVRGRVGLELYGKKTRNIIKVVTVSNYVFTGFMATGLSRDAMQSA